MVSNGMSKDLKFNVKDLPKKLRPVLDWLRRYKVFLFILLVLAAYGFIVFRINTLSRTEPDETAILEKLQSVQRPKLDQSAVKKLEDLEDQNVDVQTLFQQARDNPFTE